MKKLTLLASLIGFISFSNAQTISTIAGTGPSGYSGDGGPATSAEFSQPLGTCVDVSDNIYVVDFSNECIRKINHSTGIITTVAGNNGISGYNGDGIAATSAWLAHPQGVYVDGSGNIFIADGWNNRVRKVNFSTGIINTVAGNGTQGYSGDGGSAVSAELYLPISVTGDASGNIFIADDGNNVIRKIDHSTGLITTIAGNGTAGYNGDGIAATSAELYAPYCVYVDVSGNIFIADHNNQRIRKVSNSSGLISTVAGKGIFGYNGEGIAATSAEFEYPQGVFVDVIGDIFVADASNNRTRKVDHSTGLINTIAGNGTAGFSGDGGAATSAEINGPADMCLDGSGNIYIADAYNNRIRKLSSCFPDVTTGLVAEYNFSGNAKDNSGNGHDGTVNGATLTNDRFGNCNNAYNFNGSDSIVLNLNQTNVLVYSISAWFKTNEGGAVVDGRGSNLDTGITIFINDTLCDGANQAGMITFCADGPGGIDGIMTNNIYQDNQWHHVVGVFSGSTGPISPSEFNLYVDDSLVKVHNATSKIFNAPLTSAPNNVLIGGDTWWPPCGQFIGAIDDIRIFNTALTSCDVDSLYKMPNPISPIEISIDSQNNALCNGGTGNATANIATGGISPYTYNWTPSGGNGVTASNLSAGTYTITVTDACPNTATASVTITQPNSLGITIVSYNNVFCHGGSTGNATAHVATGGTSPYTYNWTPSGGTNLTASNLSAGTYTITAKDAHSCTASASVTITQPAFVLTITMASHTNVLCHGGSTGSATANVATGGTSPYTYSWAPNGGTNLTASSLSAGTYTITAKDINSCTATASVTITQPATSPSLTIASHIAVLCHGGSTGSATANAATGGSSPYTYNWTPNGGTNLTASNLTAGVYTITATDNHGCTGTAAINITQPTTALAITMTSHTNVLCNGGTGSATAHVATGGTSPYTYNWTPSGGTNLTASNLTAGTYTITATDNHGCTATVSVTITQPASAPAISIASHTNILCNGGTGNATANAATGGVSPYTYSWTPGGGTNLAASNLSAGTYTITATDNHGCVAIASVTITQPASALGITIASETNILCNGGTGSATANIAIGGTPFPIISTVAGNGTAGYSGDGGAAISAELNQPFGVYVDGSGNIFFGDQTNNRIRKVDHSTGLISTVAGNGTFGYNGDGIAATAAELSAPTGVFVDGSSNIFIADQNNERIRKVDHSSGLISTVTGNGTPGYNGDGIAATSAELNQPQGIYADGSGNIFIADGENQRIRKVDHISGLISTVAGNGTFGYNGDGIAATSAELYGPTGIFVDGAGNIFIADYNNNRIRKVDHSTGLIRTVAGNGTHGYNGDGIAAITAELYYPHGIYLDGSGNIFIGDHENHRIRKVDQGTGLISTVAGNGTAGYNGDGIVATAAELNYTNEVYIDGSGNIFIADQLNNRIRKVISTGNFTYAWTPSGGTNLTASNLSAGSYTITATDYNGCTATASATITQASSLSITIASHTNPTCHGGTGNATANTATGGTSPYTYNWTPNGGTNLTASNLSAGSYTITATDANSCTATASETITQPASGVAITIASHTNVLCNGGTGNATANTATGGTSPYTYLWSPSGGSNLTASNLSAGTYTIAATDANGCTGTASATITQPGAIRDSITGVTNATCANNGIATLGVKYGTPPYTYLWTPGGYTTATVTSLGAQTYTATVTDNHGCTGTARNVIISNSGSSLRDSISVLGDPGCNGGNGGDLSVGTRGSNTPFTYTWSNGATIYTISNLTAGTYTVTVKDNHGCTNSLTATLTQPATPVISSLASISYPECHGGKGTASVTASGGTPGYQYAWSPSVSTTASSTNLTAGTYTVTVSDAHGCKSSVTVLITQPNAIRDTIVSASKVNVSCNGLRNGSATIGIKYGTSPYTYLWSNGQTTATATGLSAGIYSLTVIDINGCSGTTALVSITQPSAALSATFGTITCTSNLVTVLVTASGGTNPYTYLWSPGGGTKAAMSNLAPGTYTVSVTDAHGCNTTISENLVCPPGNLRDDIVGPPAAPPQCCEGLDNITLYPNPNTGQFTLSGLQSGMTIDMYDYTGRKVTTFSASDVTMQLNISDQPNGIYLIRITDKDGKLVSQKKVAKTQ